MVNLTVPKNVSLNVNTNGELVGLSRDSTLNTSNPPLSSVGLLSLYSTSANPTFTGVPTAPTADSSVNNTQIATTAYVKNVVSSNISLGGYHIDTGANANTIACRASGGTLEVGAPTSGVHATTKTYVDNKVDTKIALGGYQIDTGANATTIACRASGGTLAVGAPTAPEHATTKNYVDGKIALGGYQIDTGANSTTIACRDSGGTLAVGAPTSAAHATTKNYVDTALDLKAPSLSPTLTGTVTISSLGGTSGIVHNNSSGVVSSSLIVDADISSVAAISDSKLATITTAGKIDNTATSATTSNVASSIVLRDNNGKANIIATTQSASDNSSKVATTEYVDRAVSNLVASAPAALDTLNELANALGNDANFSATVTNSLSLKAPAANPTLSGTVTLSGLSAGLVHSDASGILESSLVDDDDIAASSSIFKAPSNLVTILDETNASNINYYIQDSTFATQYSYNNIKYVSVSGNGQYILVAAASVDVPRLSVNAGNTFNSVSGITGTIADPAMCLSYSGQYQLIAMDGGNVFISSDYGSSWSITNNSLVGSWSTVSMSSDGKYIMIGDKSAENGTIYQSKDYGVTWHSHDLTSGLVLSRSCMTANGKIRFVTISTSGGYILRSSDYGSTWNVVTGTTGLDWNDISCSANGKYLVAILHTAYSSYYKSSDYGVSFTGTTNGNWLRVCIGASGRERLMTVDASVSSGNALLYSNDYGVNWIEVPNTVGPYFDVAISEAGALCYSVKSLDKLVLMAITSIQSMSYVDTTSVVPNSAVNGSVYFDLESRKFKVYFNGVWY